MTGRLRLNIGDLVVRHGKILKVFKISQDTVELQPFFDFKGNNDLTFTLNLKNANDGHIRQLVSKTKIKTLLNLIIKKSAAKANLPVFNAKTALTHNQLEETLWVIKTLWLEKKKNSDILSSGKSTIFRRAMLQATEEIAATNRTSPKNAKSLILSGLNSA